MNTENNLDLDIDDDQGICIREHLLIRDVDTGDVLIDQSGSTKRQDGEWDE